MITKTAFISLLLGPSLLGLAAARPAAAQDYDPVYRGEEGGPGGTETFVDNYGRVVTIDAYGRVVSVDEPRRGARRRGGDVLEGRVGDLPGVDDGFFDDSHDRGGDNRYSGTRDGSESYDGRDEALYAPVERQPLAPDQTFTGSVEPREGEPERYSSLPGPEGITAPENDPAPRITGPKGPNAKVQTAALQVLLDRAGISPGVIDGRMGSNVDKAIAAYREMTGRTIDATDSQALAEELDATGGPAVISYTITNKDVAGPYVASIPDDYSQKATLPAMSYTRVSEMLAERFHMDEEYLIEINPGADFIRPGTVLKVMAVGDPVATPVARIIADKGREQVRAYDEGGTLIAAYPSTIGSSDTPSPSGTVEVARVAFDPNYTYNPKINFKQGENNKVLTIPPGPNGPVGSIWIALSKPTYGIHGTPEPSKIGKTNSHGCVRLANFDAQELAKIVKPGVVVEFVD